MEQVLFTKIDNTIGRIVASDSVLRELSDQLTFDVPGARFSPKVRNGFWDGKIRLLNRYSGVVPIGLHSVVRQFCQQDNNQYDFQLDPALEPQADVPKDAAEVIAEKLNCPLEPYYYQNDIVYSALRNKRQIIVCPTAGGKSLAIYLMARYLEKKHKKVLIITTNVGLVDQLYNDFFEYNNNQPVAVHKITQGQEKDTNQPITISTWQGIQNQKKNWFKQFDAVIGDEVHMYDAKQLKMIIEHCVNADFKVGLTGSLKDSKTHILTLQGLFGPVHQVATLRELIDGGYIAEPVIRVIILKHAEQDRIAVNKMLRSKDADDRRKSYKAEAEQLIKIDRRNKFIADLACRSEQKGNTLILFRFVEKHGKLLLDLLKERVKNVFYIDGTIKAEKRTEIRREVDSIDRSVTVASGKAFATGSNVKTLSTLIMAYPSKSKTHIMQSIGRMLRLAGGKTKATIYDIADDLRLSDAHRDNHTLRHLRERLQMYDNEKLNYTIHEVDLS